ncbi:OmpA family protein [Sulfidibacter corallicola]|uniref:OmpA family protein n=1 Tax=Sulfidibacter corallicola TaxID=2818388 RepID=A0A8A4TWW2_SULCO|nr:flagellar motor protein MotB [Sulfidibacter corallicola]QTD53837.1 OmpA family protein [Sulfidibacter corallicola]
MSDEAPAPPPEPCKCEAGAPRWVVTFGDMMSLLLCFFVLLLSFSTTDVIKYRELTGSLKDAFGMVRSEPETQIPAADNIVATQLEIPLSLTMLVTVRAKAVRMENSNSELEMEAGADWVRIKVDGDALFESGQYTIKPGAGSILDGVGDIINEFQGTVMIEGHTDSDAPTSVRFQNKEGYLGNYDLGSLRAISVLDYLVRRKNVDRSMLVPVSFGDSKPRETNDLPEGRARNRRVEFEFRASAQAFNPELGETIRPGDQ